MKILCFSPNDAIWNWAFPQALVLEAFKKRGDEIVYISCEREFSSYCMSMAASGVSFGAPVDAKVKICDKCVRQTRAIQREFGFSGYAIGSMLSEAARVEADVLSKTGALADLIAFKLLDVPVGKIAIYETVIQNKLADGNLTGQAERFYRTIFRNAYVAVVALNAALEREKPDLCITYHTAYAYNRAFQLLGESRGYPVYFLNAGFNVSKTFRQLIVAKADPEDLFRRMLKGWNRFSRIPCKPEELGKVAEHMMALMSGGGFAYSLAMDREQGRALERLGIPPGRKILLATMSSYDELLASELAGFGWTTQNDVFASQVEWITWLFSYMSEHPDLHLVVRVHPREFQVRGVGARSQHSYLLEEAFKNHPVNVTINWPADNVPFYDLLFEADVVLNAWSSAGMEAGLLGIPVISHYGHALLFPSSLIFDVTRRDDYAGCIERALTVGWSFEQARAFYRWAALMLEGTSVDVGDAVAGAVGAVRSNRGIGWRILRRLLRLIRPDWDEMSQIRGRPSRLREADKILSLVDQNLPAFYELDVAEPASDGAFDAETAALRNQMRRLAEYVNAVRGTMPGRLQSYFK